MLESMAAEYGLANADELRKALSDSAVSRLTYRLYTGMCVGVRLPIA